MPPSSPRARERLSAGEARRLAIAAQGFGRIPVATGAAALGRMIRQLGVLQIDSVNVLERAHYLPLFARMGPYAKADLDRAAYAGRQRTLFEYWGHMASLLPVEHQPLFRWRMAAAERAERVWAGIAKTQREQADLVARVLDHVGAKGPTTQSDLENVGSRSSAWWGWSDGKRALEYLFWTGKLTTATRRNFERVYDLPERVLPKAVLEAPTPDADAAQRALTMIAVKAMGVATEYDLRDYWRLPPADSRARVAELVDAGALLPVSVEGWPQPGYLDPRAVVPRRIETAALLSPFDSLIWERDRTERIWGFRYRIEIYTPPPKRQYGYYVLPFLLDDRLVARVDLKADRKTAVLRVNAAHGEAGIDPESVAPRLVDRLVAMAAWLGLGGVVVESRGDIADTIRRHHQSSFPAA